MYTLLLEWKASFQGNLIVSANTLTLDLIKTSSRELFTVAEYKVVYCIALYLFIIMGSWKQANPLIGKQVTHGTSVLWNSTVLKIQEEKS